MSSAPDALSTVERWWPIVRDIAAFAVGVYILLVKVHPSATLQVIGFACLGVTTSGIGQRLIEKLSDPPLPRRGKR